MNNHSINESERDDAPEAIEDLADSAQVTLNDASDTHQIAVGWTSELTRQLIQKDDE